MTSSIPLQLRRDCLVAWRTFSGWRSQRERRVLLQKMETAILLADFHALGAEADLIGKAALPEGGEMLQSVKARLEEANERREAVEQDLQRALQGVAAMPETVPACFLAIADHLETVTATDRALASSAQLRAFVGGDAFAVGDDRIDPVVVGVLTAFLSGAEAPWVSLYDEILAK
jgi:hypothetical protein